MVRALHHRGPDGAGTYVAGEVALGHARLSIIDLVGGKQPIGNEDGSVQVVFNGEIFNYVELRQDLLRRGHRFATQSDTEVIVHLYEDHGADFVERLNGQFAIALWDGRARRLLLVRDRVGIRPLFYTIADGRLYFASEIKALFTQPRVERRLDLRALAETFTFWSPLPPRTAFAGIRSLPPGHLLTVEAGGEPAVRRYWDWTFPEAAEMDRRGVDECAEELRGLLLDAVRLQLRSDVPVGAYLSGGLDSSIIAALVGRQSAQPLRTFSVSFEDAEFDETPFQDQMVAYLGAQAKGAAETEAGHRRMMCTKEDIAAAFPQVVWHAEAALLRTAPVPLFLLSRRVREDGYKVVLTGEGADEVFCGYDLFKEAEVRRFWGQDPGSRARPLLLSRLYPYLHASPTSARVYAQSFFRQGMGQLDAPYFGHLPRWTTTRRTWRFFSKEAEASLSGFDPLVAIEEGLPDGIGSYPPLCRDQYIEAHTLLSGYLLCSQGDRVAMAHSVEGRFPFLDHRLIEFASRMPPGYKLRGLKEKFLLRRAVSGLLPEGIRQRTKQPYRAPDSQSFFSAGRPVEYAAELFSPTRLAESGYFDPQAAGKLFDKCRRGEALGFGDNMAFVGLLSTMLLDDLFVRGNR
jgi:asparagine synthase (glutamine-hydrolysing)